MSRVSRIMKTEQNAEFTTYASWGDFGIVKICEQLIQIGFTATEVFEKVHNAKIHSVRM
jgi:hypothetical protein